MSWIFSLPGRGRIQRVQDQGSRPPRDAHSVRHELRERFGARSTPSPQLIYSRLHYLRRNKLIRPLPADPRRHLLTVSGHRSLEARTREWDSFRKGTEVLLQRVRR